MEIAVTVLTVLSVLSLIAVSALVVHLLHIFARTGTITEKMNEDDAECPD